MTDDELEEVVGAWLAGLPSVRTRAAYGRDLAVLTAWCRAEDHALLALDPEAIGRFQSAEERSGLSPATGNRRLAAIGSFFRHARSVGATTADPVAGARRRPVAPTTSTPTLSSEEVDSLWVAVAGDARRQALVALILCDGLRLGEALTAPARALRRRPEGTVLAVDGRGRSRSVVLDPRSAAALTRLARDGQDPLLGDDGVALDRYRAAHLLRSTGRAAGLDCVLTASVLRRTCAVVTRRAGASDREVADRLGVADGRTGRRY